MKRPMMWFCLVGIFLVFLYSGIRSRTRDLPEITGDVTVSGFLIKKEIRSGKLILYLKNTKVLYDKSGNSAGKKSKGFICYMKINEGEELSLFQTAPAGSSVTVKGQASPIAPATNPGEFDAASYYGARGYFYTLFDAELTGYKGGAGVLEFLSGVREKCTLMLLSVFGEREGGVLSAMLFGDKRNLPKDLKELYTAGGIAHILAISGLHISLIGMFLYALSNRSFLSSKASFFLITGILILYGFMVGFAPSVFRAVFMFIMRILAKTLKKPYDAPTSLALSAFLTCLAFPGFTTDSSFLLTYLAVAGILFISPVFMSGVNRKKNVFDAFGVSLSVFAATLPVVAQTSGRVTFGGLLLNFVVLPAMPVLFAVSFFGIAFSQILPAVSGVFALIGKSILFTFEEASAFLQRIPFLSLCMKTPGAGRIFVYTTFVVLFTGFFTFLRRKMRLEYYRIMNRKLYGVTDPEKERGFVIAEIAYHVLFTVLLVALMAFFLAVPKQKIVTFLDVGQGDGIFIRTPDGHVFMVDGGSTSKKNVGERILEPYLLYEGEETVDLWFLTHADEDHVSGFLEILENDSVRIKRIAVSKNAAEDFREVAALAEQKGCEMLYLTEGDVVGSGNAAAYENKAGEAGGRDFAGKAGEAGGRGSAGKAGTAGSRGSAGKAGAEDKFYRFSVLSPSLYRFYEDRNAASLVLLYEEGDTKIALMGDSGREAERAVSEYFSENNIPPGELILKCAHHGSANGSNSGDFYEALKPSVCIVSSGRNNRYNHPHKEVVERIEKIGAALYNTAEYGALTISQNAFQKRKIRLFVPKKSVFV